MLLEKNAKVYLAARSEERAKAAIADLLAETGKEAIWLGLDLSSFRSIEKAAAEFHRCAVVAWFPPLQTDPNVMTSSKETELHVLFNNAWGPTCSR